MGNCITFIFALNLFLNTGVHFPAAQVQHRLSDEDCRGAGEPLGVAQNVGWSAQGQQELPAPHHQGALPAK